MAQMPHTSPDAKMPKVLWSLFFGNFVIGTGVMIVPGTLNDISTSLAISVAASAAAMCFGAPMLAGLVAGWDRRRLLAPSNFAIVRLMGSS